MIITEIILNLSREFATRRSFTQPVLGFLFSDKFLYIICNFSDNKENMSSTRPKRRAATNAAKVIEISDDDDSCLEAESPEKRPRRTVKVTARKPRAPNESESSNAKAAPKTRKPRTATKKKGSDEKATDENTPPNTDGVDIAEPIEIIDEDQQEEEALTRQEEDVLDETFEDDVCEMRPPPQQKIQGRSSFWGMSF